MNDIWQRLGLGKLLSAPEKVTGGLLHSMDKIHTESGIYALKTLNPQIMKRPEALHNMERSERIARAMKTIVPVVCALEKEGKCVFSLGEKHMMLYPWMDGKSVFPPDITTDHCAVMGSILGRIHRADIQPEGIEKETVKEETFNWPDCTRNNEWLQPVLEQREKIEKWQREANEGVKALSSRQVISHRDLDPKNVLWNGKEPLLIDWEAAGYVNPYQEMLETAYYWADDGRGSLKEELFKAFAAAYGKYIPLDNVCWQRVFSACFQGMLGWLYYNIRRGCGLENTNDEDCELGKKQVQQTLNSLNAMEKKNELAQKWIKEL